MGDIEDKSDNPPNKLLAAYLKQKDFHNCQRRKQKNEEADITPENIYSSPRSSKWSEFIKPYQLGRITLEYSNDRSNNSHIK